MLVHWIWLATLSGISDRAKRAVLQHYQDAEAVYHARYQSVPQSLSPEEWDALENKSLDTAEKILSRCTRQGVHILTLQDAAYPAKLKNIPDPPLVLYYKGTLPPMESKPVVGIVGTRQASSYGLTAAKRMGYQIAKCGGIMVSGMATGIDGVATSGAQAADGFVVGVLGNGIDIVYPASNRALFAAVEERGCLISEYPPGMLPAKWTFPRRNRIISGLSDGVLVVEAPKISGALITARWALEQGRDVFAVPGNIDVATCIGSNALLRDGAAATVTTGWDIMKQYEAAYPGAVHRWEQEVGFSEEAMPAQVAQKASHPSQKEKKEIDKPGASSYIDLEKSLSAMSEEEKLVVNRLKQGRCMADDLLASAGTDAGKLMAAVTMLEIKGVLRRLPGNQLELN